MDYRTKDENLVESVRFANEGADAQETLEVLLSNDKRGFEIFSLAEDAAVNYFISGDLLESAGNFSRARLFYEMAVNHFLIALDSVREQDYNSHYEYVGVFWDTADSYRASVNGFERMDDFLVQRATKYEVDDESEIITINIGGMC